jgi:hypothetical protein
VNYVSLSVIMEFGTPQRWMMSVKNFIASSDLIFAIGQASIHFVNLSMAMAGLYSPWTPF